MSATYHLRTPRPTRRTYCSRLIAESGHRAGYVLTPTEWAMFHVEHPTAKLCRPCARAIPEREMLEKVLVDDARQRGMNGTP